MDKIEKTDEQWKEELPHDVYMVCRQHATEPPFSGALNNCKDIGIYVCACCGQKLFTSAHKFDSGTGWPSFFQSITPECIIQNEDLSHGMKRVEIQCSKCNSHLGHLFDDGPKPTHLRYCVNSLSLKFIKNDA